MPSDILTLKREVECPDGRMVCIEANITKHEDNEGITWVKFFEKLDPKNYSHCYVDTLNPELILNAIENMLRRGKGPELAAFLKEEGRVVLSPVTFRLKLETALGGGELQGDAATGLF